jgi:hypothetical protein
MFLLVVLFVFSLLLFMMKGQNCMFGESALDSNNGVHAIHGMTEERLFLDWEITASYKLSYTLHISLPNSGKVTSKASEA